MSIGSTVVSTSNSTALSALTDVNLTGLADGQLIKYDSGSTKWINFTAPSTTTGDLTEATSSVLTISGGTDAVVGTGTTIAVKQAATAQSGFLSSTDWNTFNGKQAALAAADTSTSGYLTSTDWNTFNGKQAALPAADSTHNGYLTSTDWSTFNGKQAALSAASASVSGYLTSTDWSTFNSKQPAGSYAAQATTISTTAPLAGGGDLSANRTLSMPAAATAQSGYLSSTDWNTFNGKAAGTHASQHYPAGADPVNAQAYHGFENRTASTLVWTDTTPARTMTITGTFNYYYQGNKITVSSSPSVAITNTVGLWFIYFNTAGVLTASQTFPAFSTSVIAATIFWNGTTGAVGDERHGYARNLDWHYWAHTTVGARYGSGIDITNTGTGAAATFATTSGSIYDEDINFTVPASSAFTAAHSCRVFYQTAATTYVMDTDVSTMPFKWNGGTSRVQYVNAAGPYALADCTNTRFVNVWVYASTDINQPIYCFVETIATATTGYTSVANARAATPPTLSGFGLTPELKLLYRLVVSGAGVVQAAVAASDDYRNSSSLPSGGTASTTAASVGFSPVGTITSTNVQSALAEVDAGKFTLAGIAGGQTANGDTAASGNLTLSSTANATKGKILFGTSAYSEVTNRLGIGTNAPGSQLQIVATGANGSYMDCYSTTLTTTNQFFARKSASATVGNTVTADGEFLLDIAAQGVNSSGAFANAAYVKYVQDGAAGATYIPGRLTWFTGTNLAAPVERMRLTGSGYLGINRTAPLSQLHVASTNKTYLSLYNGSSVLISSNDDMAIDKGGDISLGGIHVTSGTTPVGFASIKGAKENVTSGDSSGYMSLGTLKAGVGTVEAIRITSTGNVGFGTATPTGILHSAATGYNIFNNDSYSVTAAETNVTYLRKSRNATKGVLTETVDTDAMGLLIAQGVNSSSARANASYLSFSQDGAAGATYVPGKLGFFTGTNAAGPLERMRIDSTGNVLHTNYTQLGSDAPKIKMKKLTGTTAAAEGGQATVNHGLTSTKIIGVQVMVEYTAGGYVSSGFTSSAEYQFDYQVTSTAIGINLHPTNSGSILSKAFVVLITYEE